MTQTELIESVQKAAILIKAQQELIDLLSSQVVGYADEEGPVNWEHVVTEVTKVLDEHNQPLPTIEVSTGIGMDMFTPQYETITILPEE